MLTKDSRPKSAQTYMRRIGNFLTVNLNYFKVFDKCKGL